MSTPAQIYSAIQSQLQNSTILNYVQDSAIMIAARESFTEFPAICIEAGKTDPENIMDSNVFVDLTLRIPLFILVKPFDPNKQIVGDINSENVGQADILNDVKKALSADISLGGVCNMLDFGECNPLLENWPTRSEQIIVIISFRQNRTTRT